MTNTSYHIDPSSVRSVASSLKAVPLAEVPDDLFNQIMKAQEDMLILEHSRMPETAGNPAYAGYANIVVNGKVVAEIDNHGGIKTSNALADAFSAAVDEADALANVMSGPELARLRAEKIAATLGGKVVKLSTAITQSAYNAIPRTTAIVDTVALANDPRYEQLAQIKQAHTAFWAQQMAQQNDTGATIQKDV